MFEVDAPFLFNNVYYVHQSVKSLLNFLKCIGPKAQYTLFKIKSSKNWASISKHYIHCKKKIIFEVMSVLFYMIQNLFFYVPSLFII